MTRFETGEIRSARIGLGQAVEQGAAVLDPARAEGCPVPLPVLALGQRCARQEEGHWCARTGPKVPRCCQRVQAHRPRTASAISPNSPPPRLAPKWTRSSGLNASGPISPRHPSITRLANAGAPSGGRSAPGLDQRLASSFRTIPFDQHGIPPGQSDCGDGRLAAPAHDRRKPLIQRPAERVCQGPPRPWRIGSEQRLERWQFSPHLRRVGSVVHHSSTSLVRHLSTNTHYFRYYYLR